VLLAARIGITAVGHLQLPADRPGSGSRRQGCQTSTLLPEGWETSLRDDGDQGVVWSSLAAFQMRVLPDGERNVQLNRLVTAPAVTRVSFGALVTCSATRRRTESPFRS